MIPQSNDPSPTMDRIAPMGSGRVDTGFLEFGTNQTAATNPSQGNRDVHQED